MNEQEAKQVAAEMWALARASHWLPASPFSYLSELGYFRTPDKMDFPVTWEGLLEARAWLRPQAASIGSTQEGKKEERHERSSGTDPAVGDGL